jgi:hypothetical protein
MSPVDPVECEICSQLRDMETSFIKYGSDEMDCPLPPAAKRLEQIAMVGGFNANDHLRRFPLCGRLYRYTWHDDYYVNGSEDEEELVRLGPEESQDLLPPENGQAGSVMLTPR